MRRAVFLDRDGVLNAAVDRAGVSSPPANLDEWRLLPGVQHACSMLHAAGFLLIVVTNQPDVARGAASKEMIETFHAILSAQLPIDDIRVCYHDNADACSCRKPAPGLLLEAASHWDIRLDESFLVGDRWKDIAAGRRAGCRTIWIADPGGNSPLPPQALPDHQVASLLDAARWILEQPRRLRLRAIAGSNPPSTNSITKEDHP